MHFYTALDWTCQDWTRGGLPFSHCALGRKMGSTNAGILFFNGDVESLLHSALEQKRGLLKCCMGVKGEGHPRWLWERREQGSAWQHSFEPREHPRTNVRARRTATVRSHTGQGRKPTVWCLRCSPGSQEMWQLALRSQVSAQVGDGGLSLCFRPTLPQQARSFLKKGSPKPKKYIPCRLEKHCRTDCTILRNVSHAIRIILICECFTQYKSQNPNPGTPGPRFLILISTVVPPAEEQKVDILISAFWSDHTTWQAETDLYFTLQLKSETSH